MSVQGRLEAWRYLKDIREDLMRTMAEPLEDRVCELTGSQYARLVGVDKDGRVRFTVRGFGEQTFTVEELDGA